MPTINFAHRYTWLSKANAYSNRPMSEVVMTGPAGSVRQFALMDSGADYMQIEPALATALGLSTAGSSTVSVSGATGSAVYPLITGVSVEIEGVPVRVDVVVGGTGTPIVGRTAMLSAIEFGLDGTGWLYK